MELTKTSGTTGVSPFAALVKMFYEPTQTFTELEPRKSAWLPLVTVITALLAVTMWYFSVVDSAWFLEQVLSQMKAAERAAAEDVMSVQTMKVTMITGQLFGLPIMCCLVGLYFMIAGKVVKHPMSFKTGFALTAWASLPAILMLPLAAIQILMASNPQFDFGALNMLSVNQLFFQYPMSNPLAAIFDSISVVSIWTAVLYIIGFQVWAKSSRSTAITVVLLPYAVIYGIWIFFALSKAAT